MNKKYCDICSKEMSQLELVTLERSGRYFLVSIKEILETGYDSPFRDFCKTCIADVIKLGKEIR